MHSALFTANKAGSIDDKSRNLYYLCGVVMLTETAEMLRIKLAGDWSMSGVSEQFPVLAECLVHLLDSDVSGGQHKSPAFAVPEIDLSGVTDLDACGCQLMALFVRNLRQNGISTQLLNMPDTFRSKIHFLGFDHELFQSKSA